MSNPSTVKEQHKGRKNSMSNPSIMKEHKAGRIQS
jgi:hypothetical protein